MSDQRLPVSWTRERPRVEPSSRWFDHEPPRFDRWRKLCGSGAGLLACGDEDRPDLLIDPADGSIRAAIPPDRWTCGVSREVFVTLEGATVALHALADGTEVARAQLPGGPPHELLVGPGSITSIDRSGSQFTCHRIERGELVEAWTAAEVPYRHWPTGERVFAWLEDEEGPAVRAAATLSGETLWRAPGQLDFADDQGAFLYDPEQGFVCREGSSGDVSWTWRYEASRPSEQRWADHGRIVSAGPELAVVQVGIMRKSVSHVEWVGLSRRDGRELWRRRWTGGVPRHAGSPRSLVLWDDVEAQVARGGWDGGSRSSAGPRPDYAAKVRVLGPQGEESVADPIPGLIAAFPDDCHESRGGHIDFLPRFGVVELLVLTDRVVVLTTGGSVVAFSLPPSSR